MDKESAYIKEIISSIQPLPPRKQVIGKTTVAWWEGKPGDAVVMAEGGSDRDEIIAANIVMAQLKKFGYKRAKFHFAEEDPTEILDRERTETQDKGGDEYEKIVQRNENWNNIIEDAKTMINNGSVTLVTNEPDYIFGIVKGRDPTSDHSQTPRQQNTYESSITRESADDPTITGWKCTCPWNQFARQRTRQWKMYEGRPCVHVLALYYAAKQSPVTDLTEPSPFEAPEQAPAPSPGAPSPFATPPGAPGGELGGPGMPGGQVPSVPEGPEGIRQLTPFKPEDVGAMDPDELLEQRLGPLAPQRNEPRRPNEEQSEEPRRNIQRPPLEQLKEMQRLKEAPAAPGQSPYGQAAPRGTVSVPGARPPSERNPMNLPGGVYSKVNIIGLDDNDNYREVKAGTKAEVLAVDEATRMAEVLFKSANVRCYVNSDDLEIN